MLTIEDTTGKIKVFFSKNKPDFFKQAKDLVLDEVIGVSGNSGDKIVFANTLVWSLTCQTQSYALRFVKSKRLDTLIVNGKNAVTFELLKTNTCSGTLFTTKKLNLKKDVYNECFA